jgi:uncharacterized sporulation protein YeaH/YhbH (DUF444 family)
MQAKMKPSRVSLSFKNVVEIAERMVWAGRRPTLSAICEELKVRCNDRVQRYFALWEAGYSHAGEDKTHITDLPSELQHLLADAFERRVIKLQAECAQMRADRDRLVNVNEQQTAQIEALTAALGNAEARIDEQARRIAGLENETPSAMR